jgi:anti-sigma factor ChrR (cupin superfamily)
MRPGDPIHDAAEQAALYAAGALPPEEAARFESQLAAGDPVCLAELKRLDPVFAALYSAGEPVQPDPRTRAALLARVASQPRLAAEPPTPPPAEPGAGFYIQRGQHEPWRDIGVPGVQMRVLFRDPGRKVMTYLVRGRPGARLPEHVHAGVEECYVLEGDLHTFDTVLTAGDYFRAAAGTRHGAAYTEQGCVLLMQSEIGKD